MASGAEIAIKLGTTWSELPADGQSGKPMIASQVASGGQTDPPLR